MKRIEYGCGIDSPGIQNIEHTSAKADMSSVYAIIESRLVLIEV
jgi:hypothetical protein